MTRLAPTTPVWRQALMGAALVALVTAAARSDEPPIAYRRILVPADSPAKWPREGDKFLPVESRDFEAWVAAANAPPAEAGIVEAVYEARLAGNELVAGRGTWRVALRDERPARMVIGDTSLMIRNAAWQDRSQSPALLGWWPGSRDQPASYALEVPRRGTLEFDWRLVPMPSAGSEPEFTLQLPPAASTRMVLDLPPGKRPTLAGSVVMEAPDDPSAGGRWVLAIATSAPGKLRIEDAGRVTAAPSSAASFREELRYELGERGIDLKARFWLTASESPPSRLNALLPAGLQLVEAQSGETELRWHVAAAEDLDGLAVAAIELPAEARPASRMIELRAWAPLAVGESARLPKPSLSDFFWTAGTIELRIDDSLQLRELSPVDCIQTEATADAAADDCEHCLRFASYSPAANVELAVERRSPSGRVRIGTTIELGNPGIAGRMRAEVRVEHGSLHRLSAALQPGWSIDAIESIPADCARRVVRRPDRRNADSRAAIAARRETGKASNDSGQRATAAGRRNRVAAAWRLESAPLARFERRSKSASVDDDGAVSARAGW